MRAVVLVDLIRTVANEVRPLSPLVAVQTDQVQAKRQESGKCQREMGGGFGQCDLEGSRVQGGHADQVRVCDRTVVEVFCTCDREQKASVIEMVIGVELIEDPVHEMLSRNG